MAQSTYLRQPTDHNLFFHVNRAAPMRRLEPDWNVPERVSETSLYHSTTPQIQPLPLERQGDRSLHYRMLRQGLLPEQPTLRRRIYTDMDPLTRIEESIPITREERQQDKLVKGVSDIASALEAFLGKSGSSAVQRQRAVQTALKTLFERYNVPMGDSERKILEQFSPAQATDMLERLEDKLEEAEDATEAERIIKDEVKKEAKHEHKEEKEEKEEKKYTFPPTFTKEEIRERARSRYGRPVRTLRDGREVFVRNDTEYVFDPSMRNGQGAFSKFEARAARFTEGLPEPRRGLRRQTSAEREETPVPRDLRRGRRARFVPQFQQDPSPEFLEAEWTAGYPDE